MVKKLFETDMIMGVNIQSKVMKRECHVPNRQWRDRPNIYQIESIPSPLFLEFFIEYFEKKKVDMRQRFGQYVIWSWYARFELEHSETRDLEKIKV